MMRTREATRDALGCASRARATPASLDQASNRAAPARAGRESAAGCWQHAAAAPGRAGGGGLPGGGRSGWAVPDRPARRPRTGAVRALLSAARRLDRLPDAAGTGAGDSAAQRRQPCCKTSRAILEHLGFQVELFGPNTFRVRAIPAIFSGADPAAAVRVVVEDFEEDETPLQAEVEARLIARVCKRSAVKAGQVLSLEEQRALLRDLEGCQSPAHLPARPADHDPPVGGSAGTAVWPARSKVGGQSDLQNQQQAWFTKDVCQVTSQTSLLI